MAILSKSYIQIEEEISHFINLINFFIIIMLDIYYPFKDCLQNGDVE